MKRELLTFFILGTLLLFFIPIPSFLLDLLFSLSILLSVMTLLMTLQVKSASEFNTFPSLLLFLTLFRLALNITSTRLILSEGEAGKVIDTFGHIAALGNPLLGLTLFFLLTLVNFGVVTKGATRVSEVAARFILEALPGKQMAIDSDRSLSSEGMRKARAKLSEEAHFYGAMDGSCKFVKGDALFGIVLILINIVGGLILGVSQGLSIKEAFGLYTILTIGDGLATQIPALLLSLSAATLITKGGEKTLAEELPKQLLSSSRPLIYASLMVLLLALLPGMPHLLMWLLGGCGVVYGFKHRKKEKLSFTPLFEIGLSTELWINALKAHLPTLKIPTPHFFLHPHGAIVKIEGRVVLKSSAQEFERFFEELTRCIEQHRYQFFKRGELGELIDLLKEREPYLVDEMAAKKVTQAELLEITRYLIKEGISLSQFNLIVEHLLKLDPTLSREEKVERIRLHLSSVSLKEVHAITLDAEVEKSITSSYQKEGPKLFLRPKTVEKIERQIEALEKLMPQKQLVVLSSHQHRYYVRFLLEKRFPHLPVLTYTELTDQVVHKAGSVTNEVLM